MLHQIIDKRPHPRGRVGPADKHGVGQFDIAGIVSLQNRDKLPAGQFCRNTERPHPRDPDIERGELTEEQLDAKLDLLSMTHPG